MLSHIATSLFTASILLYVATRCAGIVVDRTTPRFPRILSGVALAVALVSVVLVPVAAVETYRTISNLTRPPFGLDISGATNAPSQLDMEAFERELDRALDDALNRR